MILDKKMRAFLAVAEAGSFSKASRQISLSQSVLSFHVDALEKELGITLFIRQGRSIAFTEEGEHLFREGKKLANEVRRIQDTLLNHSASLAKRLSLAGDALTCAFTLPQTLTEFRKQYPGVQFTYVHLDQDTLIDKLIEGSLDIALAGHPINHRKLGSQVCFDDEICLIAPFDNFPDEIRIEELCDFPLLWVTGDRGLELLISQKLSENGIPAKRLNIFLEVDDLNIVKSFIGLGSAMAFLPKVSVMNELKHGEMKEVKISGMTLNRNTYLVYKKDGKPREIINEFRNFAKNRDWEM